MKLRKFSVEKGLENIAGKICDLNNRYLLKINEDDLNPDIPLSTDYDWKRNHRAGQTYALMGIGMGTTAVASGFLAVYEIADMVSHFGDLGAMLMDFGTEVSLLALMGLSAKLTKKAVKNIENFQQKRENKYSISASA